MLLKKGRVYGAIEHGTTLTWPVINSHKSKLENKERSWFYGMNWPYYWKVVADARKDAGILGLWRRRIQSGARDESWSLRAFVYKVLFKYKGDTESFWHRHQKGVERVLACLVLAMELYTLQWIQRMSGGYKDLTRPTPIIYILR